MSADSGGRVLGGELEDPVRSAFDVQDTVGPEDAHTLPDGVERVLFGPGAVALDVGPTDPPLRRGDDDRDLGRIAGAGPVVRAKLGVAHGRPGIE